MFCATLMLFILEITFREEASVAVACTRPGSFLAKTVRSTLWFKFPSFQNTNIDCMLHHLFN